MGMTLGIRYLCGRAIATHPADREQAEWPVHPDRVFMALAAAHFETGADPDERAALEWLERQQAHVICTTAEPQEIVTSYVPVNDTSAPRIRADRAPSATQMKSGLQLLPENRSRQPRSFPAVYPADETVYLVWEESPPVHVREALRALCRKVTYVGHSSSLVQMWLDSEPPEIETISPEDSHDEHSGRGPSPSRLHLVPQPGGVGRFRLRVASRGRLEQLEAAFQRGQRPPTAIAVGYDVDKPAASELDVVASQFSPDLIVLKQVAGPKFSLPSTQMLTDRLRQAIIAHCPDPVPEWISGHAADGQPSRRAGGHMAIVPLPHVGRQHADGHLLGLAIVVPENVPRNELPRSFERLLFDPQGWGRAFVLKLGTLGEAVFQLDDGSVYRQTLHPRTWTGPSRRWATVTPVCLDQHPRGEDYWQQVESQIADGCERIGLPRPATVIAAPSPMFVGVPHGRNMPRLSRKPDGGAIRHTHAVILFDDPVRGPILIGAGRYRGYGLCRPLEQGRASRR